MLHRHFFGGIWFWMLGMTLFVYGIVGNSTIGAIGFCIALLGLLISGRGYFKAK